MIKKSLQQFKKKKTESIHKSTHYFFYSRADSFYNNRKTLRFLFYFLCFKINYRHLVKKVKKKYTINNIFFFFWKSIKKNTFYRFKLRFSFQVRASLNLGNWIIKEISAMLLVHIWHLAFSQCSPPQRSFHLPFP